MVLLLFYYKLKDTVDQEALAATYSRMYERAAGNPDVGFRGGRTFQSSEETVTIYEFDDLAGLGPFRDDPTHRAVQRRGPEFFA